MINTFATEVVCDLLDKALTQIEFLEHMYDRHPADRKAIGDETVKLDKLYLSIAEHLPQDINFEDDEFGTLKNKVKFHREESAIIKNILNTPPVG